MVLIFVIFGPYLVLIRTKKLTLAPHHCAARVGGVALNVRDRVLQPPDYDGRNILEFVDKYGDAHICDSGWREVDTEEWHN